MLTFDPVTPAVQCWIFVPRLCRLTQVSLDVGDRETCVDENASNALFTIIGMGVERTAVGMSMDVEKGGNAPLIGLVSRG